jgi:hypothetical protein
MHVHSPRNMCTARGIHSLGVFATYLFTASNIVHSLEEYCSQLLVCNIPVHNLSCKYQRTSIPVYQRLQCELSPDSITMQRTTLRSTLCAVSSVHRPPEMSVAFTNPYAALVKTPSVRCSFCHDATDPSSCSQGEPTVSIRTTATCNRSTSAASSLPTVVIMNVTQAEASTVITRRRLHTTRRRRKGLRGVSCHRPARYYPRIR